MKEKKNFWDRNARIYNRFMRKDRAAYETMYALIRPVVKAKTVLELATGTGLIAKHTVNAAAHIEETDASAEMIAEAKRDNRSAKLHFSVQDMFCLPYADGSFDAVIVSNALHIVPQPEKALREIRRRTRVVGAFPDGNSALMLVCARLRHVAGTQWGCKKYMNMKHLEALEQDQAVG